MSATKEHIEKVCRQNDYYTGQNGNWRSYWEDLANFAHPRKAWVNSLKFSGEQLKYNFLYDTRAIRAAKECVAGFHSNLTNQTTKWFQFGTRNERYMQSGKNQRYFKEVEDIQYSIMADSNFYNSIKEFYQDLVIFGTSNTGVFEDAKHDVVYMPVEINQFNIEEDANGYVCAVWRNFRYSAAQCFERWGNSCTKEMKDAYNEGKFYLMFDVTHYVGPRDRREYGKKDKYNMEYESLWIAKKGQELLEESGFNEMPYIVCRYWKSGEDYFGYSPTMDVLASIKLLNAEKRTYLRTAMKQSAPPWAMPNRGWLAPLNANPDAINYYDAKRTSPESLRQLDIKGNSNVAIEAMEMERQEIEAGYYIPLFQAFRGITKSMTIPEVQKRISEAVFQLAPVVERPIAEGITPMLLRTFSILERKGRFPEMPLELQGKDIEITYMSPLAKQQRAGEIMGLASSLEMFAQLAGLKQNVIDTINCDKIAKMIFDLHGVDTGYVCNEEDAINRIRENTAKLMAMQQAAEIAKTGAQAAHSGAQAQAVSEPAVSK